MRKAKRPRPAGFADTGKAYEAPGQSVLRQHVELGAGGRLVIPAAMRKALGFKIGDVLTVRLEGNELRIHTFEEGIRQAQELVHRYVPAGVDAVEEFLAWKREQAVREQAELDLPPTDE